MLPENPNQTDLLKARVISLPPDRNPNRLRRGKKAARKQENEKSRVFPGEAKLKGHRMKAKTWCSDSSRSAIPSYGEAGATASGSEDERKPHSGKD